MTPDAGDDAPDHAPETGAEPEPATGPATEQAPVEAAEEAAAPVRREGTSPLLWVTVGVALAVVVLDRITKALALEHLTPGQPVQVVGEWLQLSLIENSGAAFSLGTGFTFVFTGIAVVVAVVILRTAGKLGSAWWAVALGGMLGGALGNLIDRLTRPPGFGRGYVVDFIVLPHWPVFNVADMSLVCSSVLMVVLALRGIDLDGTRAARGA